MNCILITNNPLVKKKYSNVFETIYLEKADFINVFYLTRDKIHEGYSLLTHPLSGSVKPNQTPYKSIAISKEKLELDIDSLKIMENSIAVASKLLKEKTASNWPKEILEDFQLIDLDLIISGIESMN